MQEFTRNECLKILWGEEEVTLHHMLHTKLENPLYTSDIFSKNFPLLGTASSYLLS